MEKKCIAESCLPSFQSVSLDSLEDPYFRSLHWINLPFCLFLYSVVYWVIFKLSINDVIVYFVVGPPKEDMFLTTFYGLYSSSTVTHVTNFHLGL